MCQNLVTERRVRRQLADRFGLRRVELVECLDRACYRARLKDGGVALATVEDDGSVSIYELDADGVC